MKFNIKSTAICLGMIAMLGLNSCSDFLDKNPLSAVSTETFWRNENDAKNALAGVYQTLVTSHWIIGFGGLRTQIDGLSDDGYGNASWPDLFNVPQSGDVTSTTGGVVRNYYTIPYKGIAVCNDFLKNVDRIEDFDESLKQQYIAEVKFIRAWHYSTLVQMYGGMIIIPEDITLEESLLPRSTQAETVDYILNDLDFAIQNLDETSYAGRAVKGSAQGLKMRVLLYNERWSEAASVGKEIMDSGVFGLSDNWAGMFDGTDQAGNPEIMFSIVFEAPTMRHEFDRMYGDWGSCAPLMDLVNEFECLDGKMISESEMYDSENPYLNRDPRMELTVIHVGENRPYYNIPLEAGEKPTDHLWQKGLYLNQSPPSGATNSDQDIVLIRYADILLMYAEAVNESSGPSQESINAINMVRQRPGVDMPAIGSNFDQASLREQIRHERRVELAGEGLRFFDIKRWNIAHEVVPNQLVPGSITEATPDGVHRVFADKQYLWPIPQSEIDQNPLLEQNPGY